MKIDKDRPSTWKSYDASFCTKCKAYCCSMPVEIKSADLIRLGWATQDELETSIKKLTKRLKSEGKIISYRESTDYFMMAQRPNGDCILLHPVTRLCTVYEKRPETCRLFPTQLSAKLNYCPSVSK